MRDTTLNGGKGTLRGASLTFCGPESLLPLPSSSTVNPPPASPQPQPQPQAPLLSGLTVGPPKFRATKVGAMLTPRRPKAGGALVGYEDSLAAQTNFVLAEANPGRRVGSKCQLETKLNATKKPCVRWVKVISFVRNDVAGHNQFGFTGRVGARPLPAGEYRLQATAFAPSGLNSKPVTAAFTVLPPAAPAKKSSHSR
jgi:hypothetical protein